MLSQDLIRWQILSDPLLSAKFHSTCELGEPERARQVRYQFHSFLLSPRVLS